MFPSQKRGCGQSKSITLEVLSANFHLPINDVARKVRERRSMWTAASLAARKEKEPSRGALLRDS